MATRSTQRPLRTFAGRLVLLGAGKMGAAMLEGWLARGLDPRKLTVLEPQPVKAVQALKRRGVALNPKGKVGGRERDRHRGETAERAGGAAGARALCRQDDARALDHGRPHARLSARPPARRRNRARHAEHAGRDRPRHHGRLSQRASDGAPAQAGDRSARRHRHGRMGERRKPDGRGDRGVRLRAGLRFPAGGSDDARPASPPACRRALAARLARETVAGAGELLHRSTLDAATLRQNVTSPGGTTAAALEVLMGPGGFQELLTRAIAAATRRGRELAG